MNIEQLLKNKNFRNNQNYIISKKKKKKAIQYAYIKNKNYYNVYNNWNNRLTRKLYIGEIWYIKKWFNYKYNFNFFFLFIFPLLFFIIIINIIINWWILTKTTIVWWKTTTETIILDNLTIFERLNEMWMFFLLPLIFIIIQLFLYYYNKRFYKNHLVFMNKINSNNIYLYRYKNNF